LFVVNGVWVTLPAYIKSQKGKSNPPSFPQQILLKFCESVHRILRVTAVFSVPE